MNKKIRHNNKPANINPINLLMIALTIHVFSVHSKLLYHLNPELEKKEAFSFTSLDEPTVLALVFALAYSLATVSVIRSTKKKRMIVAFAALDSLGVLLYYLTEIPLQFGAIYFAIYTGTLILSALYMDKPEYLSDQIREMKEKGISQREIAQQMQISESMVSRLLKRVGNQSGNLSKTNGSLSSF